MRSWRRLRGLVKATGVRRALCWLLIPGLLFGGPGCTRRFFRTTADKEVNDILTEKTVGHPIWDIDQYHVYPDLRSRFGDPTNPDHPPMPPDDSATWAFSPHPQQPGKPGVAYYQGLGYLNMIKAWDEANRDRRKEEKEREAERDEEEAEGKATPARERGPRLPPPREVGKDGTPASSTSKEDVRNPIQTYFDEPVNNTVTPGFLVTLDQAVELGVINSPVYQTFREDLYEVSLPVTQQRFNFAFQWAAGEDFIREWAGKLGPGIGPASLVNPARAISRTLPGAPAGELNNWTAQGSVSASKLFSTGALLSFDFANTTVWNFLAPKHTTSVSTISLDFVQPLLQGGGKAVNLEPLTEAERTLFYSIRSYARFREQFYVNIAIGTTLPVSLAAAAGNGTGASPISALAALNIASTDVSGGFTSYLSALFREVDMAADKKLVHDLQQALRLYEGYEEGGQFSKLQVLQVQSTLLTAQNTVLGDQQFVTNALDQFKLSLGLPANIPLILDDAPARPITTQYDRYYQVITDSDEVTKRIEGDRPRRIPGLESVAPAKLRAALREVVTTSRLVRGTEFLKGLPGWWRDWARASDADLRARLEKYRLERRKLLDRKAELSLKGQDLSAEQAKRLRDVELQLDLGALEQALRQYEARPWEKLPRPEQRRADRLRLFRLVAYSAEIVLVWARNERFEAVGKLWPNPPKAMLPDCEDLDLSTAEVNLAQQEAVRHALANRWDLMNARAQLQDAWRQLRVNANALMGVVDVGYQVNAITPAGKAQPFNFSFRRSTHELFINTQLPLNRLAQRNAYRLALITYQQQRRALITLEDNIAVGVRFDVRQLQLFANNYRIQKAVVASLYQQVESAKEVITAPADPLALQASGTQGQANAAALTNQYLTALSGLNGAQTRMYDIWLSYLATRMQLYLDLESLRMDARGVWLFDPNGNGGQESEGSTGKDTAGEKKPATLPIPREIEEHRMLPPPRPMPPPKEEFISASEDRRAGAPVAPTRGDSRWMSPAEALLPANPPYIPPGTIGTIMARPPGSRFLEAGGKP
jgi:hypothetical protein